VYSNRVVCITPGGSVKWTLGLPTAAGPALPSETADGDLLLAVSNKAVLRISIYGELLETLPMPSPVLAFAPIPGGYAASLSDGRILAFDIRNGRAGADTERIWESPASRPALALSSAAGTLLAVHADGALTGFNLTDGAVLWSAPPAGKIAQAGAGNRIFVSYDYDQFNIAFPGHACAYTASGAFVWALPLADSLRSPAVSGTGYVYASSADWVLWAYRAETRIKTEKKAQKAVNYGILNGKSVEFGMPFASDPLEVRFFFDRVADDIQDGTVGTGESGYARRLSEILSNRMDGRFGGRMYDVTERGRAATLLGQMGSYEYREPLLEAAYGEYDPSLAIGILYGLAALGNDRDGRSLAAVAHLVRKAGARENAVLRAACDALYALVRYSAGRTAVEGTQMLSLFLVSPYDGRVQSYARNIIGNILQ